MSFTYLHIVFIFLSVILGSPFQMGYCWSPPLPALYRGSHKATAPRQQVQGSLLNL